MSEKTKFPPREFLYPAPVVLVSCVDSSGKSANIITIAWCGVVCSRPPLLSVSIRPSRHSHKLIAAAGDFTVNIPRTDMLQVVDLCGVISGKNTDKFKSASFTRIPAERIASPLIKECPVNIECRLHSTVKLGSHDMFIGEVLMAHIDKDLIDKNGDIDYAKASPMVYNQGEYWSLGERLGRYGCSSK